MHCGHNTAPGHIMTHNLIIYDVYDQTINGDELIHPTEPTHFSILSQTDNGSDAATSG